jgi:hypothetical protein
MDAISFPEAVEVITVAGNVCTRCGKPRVAVKTYEEVVQTSTVTYTIMECSDPDCQSQVNKTLKAEEVKRNYIKSEQEKRELQRQELKKHKSID